MKTRSNSNYADRFIATIIVLIGVFVLSVSASKVPEKQNLLQLSEVEKTKNDVSLKVTTPMPPEVPEIPGIPSVELPAIVPPVSPPDSAGEWPPPGTPGRRRYRSGRNTPAGGPAAASTALGHRLRTRRAGARWWGTRAYIPRSGHI